MTAVITKSKIATNAHTNIFSYVNNRNYITDPRHPSSTTTQRDFIYDYDPILKDPNFGDFPFIVVNLPTIDYGKTSSNGKVKWITWTQQLVVRTMRSGSGNTYLNTDMLDIVDDLHGMFNNETVKSALRLLNMYKMVIKEIDNDMGSFQDRTVLESIHELTYNTRMTVSD